MDEILHFNSKTLSLKQVDKKSTAIAVTETWFNEDESDLVEIDGYEMFFFFIRLRGVRSCTLTLIKNLKLNMK